MPTKKLKESLRRWRKLAVTRAEMLHEMHVELVTLALLSSDHPEFFNPLHIAKAKQIRDRVLAEHRRV
jgi:hypothetical protein